MYDYCYKILTNTTLKLTNTTIATKKLYLSINTMK